MIVQRTTDECSDCRRDFTYVQLKKIDGVWICPEWIQVASGRTYWRDGYGSERETRQEVKPMHFGFRDIDYDEALLWHFFVLRLENKV